MTKFTDLLEEFLDSREVLRDARRNAGDMGMQTFNHVFAAEVNRHALAKAALDAAVNPSASQAKELGLIISRADGVDPYDCSPQDVKACISVLAVLVGDLAAIVRGKSCAG